MIYSLYLIGGIAVGFFFASYRSRRQVKEYKKALEEIMYITHHQGINPRAKRIRGLTNVGSLGVAKVLNLLDLLSTNRNTSISLSAMREAAGLNDIFKKITSEALELENEVLDTVKDFEHLQ